MTFSLALTQAPQHSYYNGGITATARQYYLRPTQHTPNGGRIAAAVSGMVAGEFRTIWANNADFVFSVHLEETGVSYPSLDWTPRAIWHEPTQQIIIGGRRGSYKYIAYSDVTGDWRELAMHPDMGRNTGGTAHYYGMITQDDAARLYVGHTEKPMFRLEPETETWTRIADHLLTNGSNGSMWDWSPHANGGTGGVIKYGGDAKRWLIYNPATDTWTNPYNNLGNGQHALLAYNPTAQRFLLVGGSLTLTRAMLVTNEGVATLVTSCPAEVTMSPDGWVMYHPAGCWLVRSGQNQRLYACWPNAAKTDVTWQDLGASPDAGLTYPTVAADYDRDLIYIISTTGLHAYKLPEVTDPGSALVTESTQHAHAAENIQLAAGLSLQVDPGSHAHTAADVALSYALTLTAQDATHAHAADNLQLAAALTLVADAALHAHTADNLDVYSGLSFDTASATHAHAANELALSSSLTFSVLDALHNHFADTLAVSSAHSLVADNATHSHAADNIVFATGLNLDTASSTHAHLAEALALSWSVSLSTSSATHSHAADNLALAAALNLLVDAAIHAHSATTVTLDTSSAAALTTQDATHNQTAENATLTATLSLAPSGGQHAHTASTETLSALHNLSAADAAHAQLADTLAASTGFAMSIQSAFHTHVAYGVALEQALTLAVQDALHEHAATAAELSAALHLLVEDALHTHSGQQAQMYIPVPLADELRRSVFLRLAEQRPVVRVDQQAPSLVAARLPIYLRTH